MIVWYTFEDLLSFVVHEGVRSTHKNKNEKEEEEAERDEMKPRLEKPEWDRRKKNILTESKTVTVHNM